MNKKIIIITILLIITIFIVVIILFNAVKYLNLKKDCIKNNTNKNGYSVSLDFSPNTTPANIDKFVDKIIKMAGVQNVKTKNKDEAFQEFITEQANEPEVLRELNEIGTNPFPPSITVESSISDIETFLQLETNILTEAEKLGLKVTYHSDGNLDFLQQQLIKVRDASLLKDLFRYVFSRERDRFFEKYYSPVCNPNFLKNTPFKNINWQK